MRRALAATVVLAYLGLALPARAETVAVLDTVIDGVPPEGRDRLLANLEEGLEAGGFTILPHTEVRERLAKANAPSGCSFGPCLRAVGQALGVELVLVVRIVADGPSFSFVLTLVDTKSGAPVAQVSDSCAVCTYDEATSATTLAVVDLGHRYQEITHPDEPPAKPHPPHKRHAAAWWMTGAAVVVGGAAAYILAGRSDLRPEGYGAAGAAGGLLIGGVVLFTL